MKRNCTNSFIDHDIQSHSRLIASRTAPNLTILITLIQTFWKGSAQVRFEISKPITQPIGTSLSIFKPIQRKNPTLAEIFKTGWPVHDQPKWTVNVKSYDVFYVSDHKYKKSSERNKIQLHCNSSFFLPYQFEVKQNMLTHMLRCVCTVCVCFCTWKGGLPH